MDPWTSHSNSGKQTLVAVGSAVVGAVLCVGFRGFATQGTNALAGFLLGVLLLVIGVLGFLLSGSQTVVVGPRERLIIVEDADRFGRMKRVIPFGEVGDILIGYLGKKSNHVEMYYLVLKLKSGENYPLFAPGRFYEGGSDRSVVEGWRRRLEEYLAATGSPSGVLGEA